MPFATALSRAVTAPDHGPTYYREMQAQRSADLGSLPPRLMGGPGHPTTAAPSGGTRIALFRKAATTDIIDFVEEDLFERIKAISKGESADAVIDAVGMEAGAGHGQGGILASAKKKILPSERTFVLDQAIRAVRPGGTVSVPGVYVGPVSVDMGAVVQKSLKLVSGQASAKRYRELLTRLIQEKTVDTTSIIPTAAQGSKTSPASTRRSSRRRMAARKSCST